MQIANIVYKDEARVAVRRDGNWAVLPSEWNHTSLRTTDDFIRWPGSSLSQAAVMDMAAPLPEGGCTWRPAVIHPEKIFCIGLNYRRHAQESGLALPDSPVVFSKFSNTLAAHQEPVPLPPASSQIDYEVELAIVIGQQARNLSVAEALQCVWGYTIANDVSARDLQMKTSQWLLGKSCDKFLPLGPAIASADEIPDPDSLDIALWLNGESRQHSNTRDMIFSCAEIVSYLSRVWTLQPGDVICTGTPEGVILGRPLDKRDWLKAGDEVRLTIEGLGEQTTRFVAPDVSAS